MNSVVIKPFNVTDRTELPELSVNQIPEDGEPIEIKGEMYFVCETSAKKQEGPVEIGVIPLVVRNPAKVQNIDNYLKCLSIAHRRVRFKNKKGDCDLNNCDEMVIS